MNTYVQTNCAKCGIVIERDTRFVGSVKFSCFDCKRKRREEYDKKRNKEISKILKKYRI